ncbi:tryptophan 2,3-dioxygenase family protein [Streptosporangium sp. NBC_01639]|uniref:tryptophan 2,3-dioxygenase n=1 Tax=unclassified Streptosporangium TaxID=2632669 RepID=UPI002DD8DA3A|nr:tryptophan 2,3-dioxygenase family protein [Streptosporangium sp. NBC_01756]WSC88274.1 tryptophan 2,3-dioxygenase family protein [Streptosporangium sp. NBC_01756]WTD53027.1 tryptophan 2,3-dioxygenase family protein [Streptosporangium sp. NBC_01639]
MEPTGRVRPTSASERAERARAGGGLPTLEFEQEVPYDAYVRTDILHDLQRPLSDAPGEMSFLVITQVMELYFKLITFELSAAQESLRADRVRDALAALRRTALHLEGLNASWRSLRWMTPSDFNRFRDQLGEASGLQSSMYRLVEFRLGLKNEALIRPFKRSSKGDVLHRVFAEPSVWDDTIALLARHGYHLPDEVLNRDFGTEYEPHEAVERAWVEVYRDDSAKNDLVALGDALTEVSELFGDWRYQHVAAVRRSMGAKPGSGGSNGLAWLERSMARVVFPELWSARTHM